MKHFLRELRRRRVPQVLGFYLATSWVAIEVSDTVFPRLGLPDWTVTFILVLLILGLPVALVLAWFYDLSSEGIRRTPPTEADPASGPTPPPAAARGPASGRIAVAGAVVVLALAGASWIAVSGGSDAALEEGTVAVLPFRVSGELDHLREGMVDLLSTKLSGEVGPRAIDPRLTLRVWREKGQGEDLLEEEAAAVARRTGASHVLTGDVVSAGGSVTLSATIAPSHGRFRDPIRASITGPADSVLQLVDHLAAELLGLGAGLETEQVTALTSSSLDAVVAHLRGLKAYRAGQFEEAAEQFGRAVDMDSTFAMAAYYQNGAMGWGFQTDEYHRAARLAWTFRDRLNRLDRARVQARFGPRGPGTNAPAQERMAAIRGAMGVIQDDPEIWHELGDLIFHFGHRQISPDPVDESRKAFARAVELDPGFGAPLHHLIELTARGRDTAALRRYYDRYTEQSGLETSGAVAPGYTAGLGLGDSAILGHFEPRLREVPRGIFGYTIYSANMAGLPMTGLRRAARDRVTGAATRTDRASALWTLPRIERATGRSRAFTSVLDELEELGEDVHFTAYVYGIAMDGDSADARTRMERGFRAAGSPEDSLALRLFLARQRTALGDTTGAATVAREAMTAEGEEYGAWVRSSGLELEAILSVLEQGPGATAAVARVDSFASLTPDLPPAARAISLLLTARLWEELGAPEEALAVARRLGLEATVIPVSWLLQARLAAQLGLHDEAVHTYRLYLDLRQEAEPGTRAHENLEAARRELAALVREGG